MLSDLVGVALLVAGAEKAFSLCQTNVETLQRDSTRKMRHTFSPAVQSPGEECSCASKNGRIC